MEKRNIPFSPPDMSELEIEEVKEAILSGWITTGPRTKEFEKQISEYVGTKKTVCFNSATAAMELTLHVLGVGPGDEVIVPAYTYTASCSVICHVGATPVMIDCAKNSFEMDYDKLPDLITEKTKVIIPVDLAGIICDYKKIYEAVESRKNLFKANNDIQKVFNRVIVMADSAHGFGATQNGIHAGAIADFTCFSFHAVKNLTTAEGGAVTWKSKKEINDEDLYKQYQLLSLHGQTKDALSKNKLGAWEYDIVMPAYKCNMTDINAAIGLVQLKRYPEMLGWRHEIIRRYDEAFKDLPVTLLDHRDKEHQSSGHLYFVRVNNITEEKRNEIIIKMAEKGIACNVHYKPLPMLTAYKNLGFDIENYPNAYDQYKNQITLPLYTKLVMDDIDYILRAFEDSIKETL
ncbi:DegT/DnrJ/EryC1/StrS family aminotransferase [[Clostridium] innocuum]|uniref:DegT/DnrJ/EryC1/StrS family aminotransferase n=2 Tax=Bacillota TaxID=1239 RepID=A0A3E2W0S6_CLOIN|nr:DegT/DnrJ/EryC1/StrS family aminotransferase [[Clostridium] innocuum]MCR0235265.1 DegT/DnrJ/EryC1/StrS family aminotransferase [[Clostridium] innocuum]MCR0379888.1 DegT/DnrJ/EryC1/StrS family aminotransferase [[Clostridium] innocuum]RGC17512.1 DegT/DnrJ/EryC1/StrS family aminotransferase [[Clostridium] innocuum]